MKLAHRVLALLIAFLLPATQVLAISGGPNDQSGSVTSILGTYSGVLIPQSDDTGVTDGNDTVNSIGIFSLGIPDRGPGEGSFLAFSEGFVFTGTIFAVSNPSKGKISGILQASYEYSVSSTDSTGAVTTVDVTAQVTGTLDAKVEENIALALSTATVVPQELDGEARLAVSLGLIDAEGRPVINNVLIFAVEGIRQSIQVSSGDFAVVGG
jgi:hypothetical protein